MERRAGGATEGDAVGEGGHAVSQVVQSSNVAAEMEIRDNGSARELTSTSFGWSERLRQGIPSRATELAANGA
jgi:hypothetical protein